MQIPTISKVLFGVSGACLVTAYIVKLRKQIDSNYIVLNSKIDNNEKLLRVHLNMLNKRIDKLANESDEPPSPKYYNQSTDI
ncbi:MAG: hypothetical protein Faunusvirus4_7 [Faunusvirus sp.]|jgi:hypothetical protein|uniref:Uncharacterized protein n=1 Tax=Faunusvirus sp. TaxID=2487766 RepID=A0A3G4ZW98_9VIRU|nr:MAG: hypothetical protein Faunusvirus4_7 [Faunusvirus sp.]